jgi:hypothetical protein
LAGESSNDDPRSLTGQEEKVSDLKRCRKAAVRQRLIRVGTDPSPRVPATVSLWKSVVVYFPDRTRMRIAHEYMAVVVVCGTV